MATNKSLSGKTGAKIEITYNLNIEPFADYAINY
jgi:hypothetical protein